MWLASYSAVPQSGLCGALGSVSLRRKSELALSWFSVGSGLERDHVLVSHVGCLLGRGQVSTHKACKGLSAPHRLCVRLVACIPVTLSVLCCEGRVGEAVADRVVCGAGAGVLAVAAAEPQA